MNTYRVQITWVETGTNNAACKGWDEEVTIMAESEDLAIEEAEGDHLDFYGEEAGEKHEPEGEIVEWCVCGRSDEESAFEPVRDGFRCQKEACKWLSENFADIDACEGFVSFYVDWNTNDSPADLWAVVEDGELEFQLANGHHVDATEVGG